ncbi:MAG: sugar ABC transporter substrate-binding protein [Acidimicrobiales bacterium]
MPEATNAGTRSGATAYTIGFSRPQGRYPVLAAFQAALAAGARREGISVTSLTAPSVTAQVADIQRYIGERVKAIVVYPLAGPPLVPVLSAARKAGIAVVGYDAVLDATGASSGAYPYNADLNSGLVHQGAMLVGEYVAQQLHGTGNVLGVDATAPAPGKHAFISAEQNDVTTAGPEIDWLETVTDVTDDVAGATRQVAVALAKYRDRVDAVIASSDGAAIGAARSLDAAKVKAVVVGAQGGTDGINALKSGEIDATINVMPYNQALIALAMIRDLVAGKAVPPVVHAPVQLVTAQDLSQYVPWSTGLEEVASGQLRPPTSITPSMGG